MIVRWSVLFFLLFFVWGLADAVHVGQVTCGTTIPIDSNFLLDPSWSLSPHRNDIQQSSGGGISFSKLKMPDSINAIIESEAGADPAFVILFQLQGENLAANCSVFIDPLKSGLAGRTASGMRIVALHTDSSTVETCPLNATIAISNSKLALGQLSLTRTDASSHFAHGASFPVSTGDLPLSLEMPSGCQVQLLVLVRRAGSITPWYVWIPTTVYSALITLIMIPQLLLRRSTPTTANALVVLLVFLGYLGSMIGLIVEVICWQSSLGRMFPFPSSVTLYCCLVVLYALYMVGLFIRHPHRRLLLIATMRLLVYGANVALCVGYWIAGYVVLGSLAIFQYLLTNCFLTAYYAYASVRLKRAAKKELPVSFARILAYMWLAPATPFAVCALFYIDLDFVSAGRGRKCAAVHARLADAVYLYNVQVSIPLVFMQNVYGIALLSAATAFHMPFLVVLFPLLLLFILQMVCTCEQYISEYCRWMRRKPYLQYCAKQKKATGSCGFLFLSPAFEFIFDGDHYHDCLDKELQANAIVYQSDAILQAVPPTRRGVDWTSEMGLATQSPPLTTYEHDMAMLRRSRSPMGTPVRSMTVLEPAMEEEEAVYFPPLPSRSPSRHQAHSSAQPTPAANRSRYRGGVSQGASPMEDNETDYSTPARRQEEYWPDSVER